MCDVAVFQVEATAVVEECGRGPAHRPAAAPWEGVLRSAPMPLADLERFAALARRGPGNETERLRLRDAHRQRVDAQIQALEECRSVIAWRVGVYAEHLARDEAGGFWALGAMGGRWPGASAASCPDSPLARPR